VSTLESLVSLLRKEKCQEILEDKRVQIQSLPLAKHLDKIE
jgi:hypothetical protein